VTTFAYESKVWEGKQLLNNGPLMGLSEKRKIRPIISVPKCLTVCVAIHFCKSNYVVDTERWFEYLGVLFHSASCFFWLDCNQYQVSWGKSSIKEWDEFTHET